MNAPAVEPALPRGLPDFSHLDPATLDASIRALLADNEASIEALLAAADAPTWDSFCAPLEALNDRIQRAWSPVRHLHSVADTEALRAAYNAVLPEVVRYGTALLQNDRLCQAWRRLQDSPAAATLTPARRTVIEHALRDFRLGGIELDPARRARFMELQQRLNQLGTRFEEHVLDATRAWTWHTTDENRLRGLPPHLHHLAAQNAAERQLEGWVLTLDLPCYQAAMLYAEDRELRATLYEAYSTRASELGPNAGQFDNGPVIAEILALRHELARLVGFDNFAEYSLATKMAPSVAGVLTFLRDLAARSRPHAERDMAELRAFARTTLGLEQLEAWDVAFASERLRQQAYSISQEQIRPYFPVVRVLEGLFTIIERLFGVRVEVVSGVDTWHPDVRVHRLVERDSGALRGLFYLDLFARTGKRGGAWMDECLVRRQTAQGLQHPVAYLTCNFTPPVAGQPSLLTHEEVITLFHEFGHGLHHMLTRVDEAAVSGINGVAWDAVELPSQFLENWCWEEEALALLAGHHVTGDALPPELVERMRAARNFQSGMKMLRQLEFALFDFELHGRDPAALDVQALLDAVRREVAVAIPPAWNRFQHSFTHIFGGGYAAGYYSYKWAEVLAADAYSRFEEEGVFSERAGRDFLRHILEAGGATDAMELFRRFRGRDPSPDALLRHSGLLT